MRRQKPWVTRFQFALAAAVLYALIAVGLFKYAGITQAGDGSDSLLTMAVALVALILGFGARGIYEFRQRRGGQAQRLHV